MTPPLDQILAPPAQQAVIAGLFLSAGWWVVAWQGRRRDAKLRAERVRDVQRAIFAEIRAYVTALRDDDLATYGEAMARRIEGEAGFLPIIPTEANDAIFRAIIADIHILPRDTIDPIVVYYGQLNAIGASIADLRALDPDRVSTAEAAQLYRDYVAFKRGALGAGLAAMQAIARNVDGTAGAAGRRRRLRPFSSPDADGSGR